MRRIIDLKHTLTTNNYLQQTELHLKKSIYTTYEIHSKSMSVKQSE